MNHFITHTIRIRKGIGFGVLALVLFFPPSLNAQTGKSGHLIDRIQPHLNDATFGMIHFSLSDQQTTAFLGQFAKGLDEPSRSIAMEINQAAATLAKAGVSDVCLIAGWTDKGETRLRTVLVTGKQADSEKIHSAIRQHAFLFPNNDVQVAALTTTGSSPDPGQIKGLKSAFDAHKKSPIKLILAPGPLQRKALAELGGDRFGADKKRDVGSIEEHLWTCIYIDIENSKGPIHATVKLKDQAATSRFAQRFLEMKHAFENDVRLRKTFSHLNQMLQKVECAFSGDSAKFELHDSLKGDQSGIMFLASEFLERTRTERRKKNLSEVVIGMHTYHDANGRFPGFASRSKDDQPLLSWRVMILPYIGETKLYQQFKLDEPWDSEHNRKLIKEIPVAYRGGNLKLELGKTTVQTLNGKKAGIDTGMEDGGITFVQFRDGTSNTILVVDTLPEKAVTWTRPADFELDKDDLSKGLVAKGSNGFLAARADSWAEWVEVGDKEKLKALVGRSDGIFSIYEEPKKPDNVRLPDFWIWDFFLEQPQ